MNPTSRLVAHQLEGNNWALCQACASDLFRFTDLSGGLGRAEAQCAMCAWVFPEPTHFVTLRGWERQYGHHPPMPDGQVGFRLVLK